MPGQLGEGSVSAPSEQRPTAAEMDVEVVEQTGPGANRRRRRQETGHGGRGAAAAGRNGSGTGQRQGDPRPSTSQVANEGEIEHMPNGPNPTPPTRGRSHRREYRCNYCPADAPTKSSKANLMRHLRTHTGERPYPCTEPGCGKAFKWKVDLDNHRRTHSGATRIPCPHPGCGRTFAQSSNLTVHVRTHTGEKPYRCDFEGCSKAFATGSDLTKHRPCHTGEKPYRCSNCGQGFTQNKSLTEHRQYVRCIGITL